MNSLLRPVGLLRNKFICRTLAAAYSTNTGTKENLTQLVNNNKIVVFMKGTPEAPRCGFSNAVVTILNFHGVKDYDAHDVLQDEDVRQGIKEFSQWPTIPQVYLDGEFLGGCDIMMDMHKNGDFIDELKKVGIRSALLDAPPPEKSG